MEMIKWNRNVLNARFYLSYDSKLTFYLQILH